MAAALRALVTENRKLQGELEASQPQPAQATEAPAELPSSSALRPAAHRGTRLAKPDASRKAAEEAEQGPPDLQLHGFAAPTAAVTSLPGPAGFLRQPAEEVRRPRSASDRGTQSQRKALDRLRAAQTRHEEAAAAAAEQRQKVLPLIRWRDAATEAADKGDPT
ncbi:unnamed protein product [Effrenium voratum]|nr:unnamed protein product [Effrenium voratum]